MTPEEVKSVARETARETVTEMLGALGVDTSPEHLQKTQASFVWLRRAHENSESFRKVLGTAIVIAVIGGFGAMLWDTISIAAKSVVMGWTGK